MNSSSEMMLPEGELEAWLDRLVDGELSDAERRELLQRLEQAPAGWRRCALAFLESQAWREAIKSGERRAESGEPARIRGATSNIEHRTSKENKRPFDVGSFRFWISRPILGIASAAACFVVAFGLGLLAHRFWLTSGDDASLVVRPSKGSTQPSVVRGDAGNERLVNGRWGKVQFVVDGPGGMPREIELPAVEGLDPEEFFRNQPVLPPEIERELRRLGHRIETRREFVPIPLEDGRRVLFPVDNVEVRLVGGRGYQ
jgi:hypothetical protein